MSAAAQVVSASQWAAWSLSHCGARLLIGRIGGDVTNFNMCAVIVLVGNKVDLESERQVLTTTAKEYADR